MKFKDKNGNVFVPTSKCMEEQMKQSEFYTEMKKEVKRKEVQENK